MFVSPGYDVQSASSRESKLYITGAPRYNHTGRVVIYKLDKDNKVVVSQILKGEQVSPSTCTIEQILYIVSFKWSTLHIIYVQHFTLA